jgi:hypothetical protein
MEQDTGKQKDEQLSSKIKPDTNTNAECDFGSDCESITY